MIAKPFGKTQPIINYYQNENDSDTTYLVNKNRESELGEKIYSGNILRMAGHINGVLTGIFMNKILVKDVMKIDSANFKYMHGFTPQKKD